MLRPNPKTKVILRLESLEDFRHIPAPVREAVSATLNIPWDADNFDIHIISEDEKYAAHYLRRLDAINAGAQFLLDSIIADIIPHDEKQHADLQSLISLKAEIQRVRQCCSEHIQLLESNHVDDILYYQNSLANFSHCIQDKIQWCALELHSKDLAAKFKPDILVKQLDRAEQFATALTTRPSVCTIFSLHLKPNEYVAMIDKPQNPFNEELIKELTDILQSSQMESSASGITDIPEWFEYLKDYDKRLLLHFLASVNISDFGTAINALSSKLRIIPAPANYGKHTIITYVRQELPVPEDLRLMVHRPEIRSSHIASRDTARMPVTVRNFHATSNLQKEIQDAMREEIAARSGTEEVVIPILYQTLITPLLNPDLLLNTDKITAIENCADMVSDHKSAAGEPNLSFVLIDTNHPLNYGKMVKPTFSFSLNAENIETLLFVMSQHQPVDDAELAHEASLLLQACTQDDYKIFYEYRELYLSSLEQIFVALHGGISIGSCVSGKDRKAIEIAHTDAMKVYLAKYHSLPPMTAESDQDAEAMENFARLFAEIYCTKHQMVIADFNAPGSFGVKTPGMYLPDHLKKAVKIWYAEHKYIHPDYAHMTDKDIFKESDVMASNNDLKHVKPIAYPQHVLLLAWHAHSLHIHDVYSVDHLLESAKAKINEYVSTRTDHMYFWSRFWDDHRDEQRAIVCSALLEDLQLTSFQKMIVIFALLSSAGQDFRFKDDVAHAMHFTTLAEADKVLADYMLYGLMQNGMLDAHHELVTEIKLIQVQFGRLAKDEEVPECIHEIKGILERYASPRKAMQPE